MPSTPAISLFPAQLDTLNSTPQAANNLATTLTGAITALATTLPVASTTSFPPTGAVTIGSEIIFYAGVGANSLMNCVRGYDGTSSTTHTAGDAVEMLVIAAHANIVATGLIAVEAKLGSGASMPVAGTVLQATGAGTTEWGTLNASVLTSGTIDPARIPVLSRLDVVNSDPNQPTSVFQNASQQNQNSGEWKNSDGVTLAKVDAQGGISAALKDGHGLKLFSDDGNARIDPQMNGGTLAFAGWGLVAIADIVITSGQTNFGNSDVFFLNPNKGIVLKDRATGAYMRAVLTNGVLSWEAV